MAVFKNYYNRKSHWTAALSCLYLLCSTISCTLVNGERVRHHHIKINEESRSQLEKSQIEDSSKNPVLSCPNCLYKNDRDRERSETDKLRLEAIKKQILSKLGLRQKPNVTHSLPKEVIWETLYRAEDENSDFLRNFDSEENFSTTSAKSSTMETVDVDDFYGRTSEIISFAEEGKSQHPILNPNKVLRTFFNNRFNCKTKKNHINYMTGITKNTFFTKL